MWCVDRMKSTTRRRGVDDVSLAVSRCFLRHSRLASMNKEAGSGDASIFYVHCTTVAEMPRPPQTNIYIFPSVYVWVKEWVYGPDLIYWQENLVIARAIAKLEFCLFIHIYIMYFLPPSSSLLSLNKIYTIVNKNYNYLTQKQTMMQKYKKKFFQYKKYELYIFFFYRWNLLPIDFRSCVNEKKKNK